MKTATGSREIISGGLDRLESNTMDLVDGHFSPNMYGPHVRSKAGMLAVAAYQRGVEHGRMIAELKNLIVRPLIPK